jgi:hypothetical protein
MNNSLFLQSNLREYKYIIEKLETLEKSNKYMSDKLNEYSYKLNEYSNKLNKLTLESFKNIYGYLDQNKTKDHDILNNLSGFETSEPNSHIILHKIKICIQYTRKLLLLEYEYLYDILSRSNIDTGRESYTSTKYFYKIMDNYMDIADNPVHFIEQNNIIGENNIIGDMSILCSENLEFEFIKILFTYEYNELTRIRDNIENDIMKIYGRRIYDISKGNQIFQYELSKIKSKPLDLYRKKEIIEIRIRIIDIGRKLANYKIKESLCKKLLEKL